MKYLMLVVFAFAMTGCFAGVTGHTRTCIPDRQGMAGCESIDARNLSDKTHPRHVKLAKLQATQVEQTPADNPKHMAEAMEAIQPYCPMHFDDPEQGPEDHFQMALAARMFAAQINAPDPDGGDIVRQMFLNCWALSVHHGLSDHRTFYEPLYALSPYLQAVKFPEPTDDEDFIQLLLGPSGE